MRYIPTLGLVAGLDYYTGLPTCAWYTPCPVHGGCRAFSPRFVRCDRCRWEKDRCTEAQIAEAYSRGRLEIEHIDLDNYLQKRHPEWYRRRSIAREDLSG